MDIPASFAAKPALRWSSPILRIYGWTALKRPFRQIDLNQADLTDYGRHDLVMCSNVLSILLSRTIFCAI